MMPSHCVFNEYPCDRTDFLGRGLCAKHYQWVRNHGDISIYPILRVRGGTPESREAQIVVRVPVALLDQLKAIVKARRKKKLGTKSGGSLRAVVREAIEAGVEKVEKETAGVVYLSYIDVKGKLARG